jgi:two-component system chemotaxis response regulator CheY
MRGIIARILRELGFDTIEEAEHGKHALEVLGRSAPFALAMVDWNMPVMDGHQLVQAVRKDERWNGMLMVMCTTETEVEQITQALEAGANEYVMKPFTKEDIQSKLAILGLVQS